MENNLLEVSVELHEKALGINLRPILGNRGAYIDSFYRQETSQSLQIGDILHFVGNVDVSEERIEDIQRILKRSTRPIHLSFRRYVRPASDAASGSSAGSSSGGYVSPSDLSTHPGQFTLVGLEVLVDSPFFDIWIRKFLKSTRVYFGDKEDYKLFVKLQEIYMLLTSMSRRMHTTDSLSPGALHQLLLYMYQQLTDVHQQNDVVFPIPSSDCIALSSLVACVKEYLSILYLRGLNTIFSEFQNPAYLYMQHMHAYYSRSLYQQPALLLESLAGILQHHYDHLYLYLFLYKYPVLTGLMHEYRAAPCEERCVAVLVSMMQSSLVLRFYASEYYQLYLEEVQRRSKMLDGCLEEEDSAPKVMWTQYLPRTCSLIYPTNNSQPKSVYDLSFLHRCVHSSSSVRRIEWKMHLSGPYRGVLAINDRGIDMHELARQQLQELLSEFLVCSHGDSGAQLLLALLQISRSCQSMCIVRVISLEPHLLDSSADVQQLPVLHLEATTSSLPHMDDAQTTSDARSPFASASEVLSAVQPSIGYLANLTNQANRSLMATFKKQLPAFSSWMRVKPDQEGVTTTSSPVITQNNSAVTTSDSIDSLNTTPIHKPSASDEATTTTACALHGTLFVLESEEDHNGTDASDEEIPFELRQYAATLTPDCVLEIMSPHQLCLLMYAFLLERKIIVLIPNVTFCEFPLMLSDLLCSLLKPLSWQHVYAPLLSSSTARQLLGCPAPYILGCTVTVFEEHLKEQNADRVEDCVVVSLSSDGLSVDINSKDICLAETKSEWLLYHMQAILQPAFCRYASTKRVASKELRQPSVTSAYPATILNVPIYTASLNQSKLESLVSLCRYFVECLLYGSSFCCYTDCVQASSGTCLPDSRKSRRRSIAGEHEGYSVSPEETRECAIDEVALIGEAGSEANGELSYPVRNPANATEAATDMINEPSNHLRVQDLSRSSSEAPMPAQRCTLFDERMFLDIKRQQQEIGQDMGFSEGFVRAFLRSQCLAVYLASC